MNSALTILLVSSNPGGCSHFLNHLGHERSHTMLARDAEDAARLLLAGTEADVILIHHESISSAGLICSALKIIRPLVPVIVVTSEWPASVVFPPRGGRHLLREFAGKTRGARRYAFCPLHADRIPESAN